MTERIDKRRPLCRLSPGYAPGESRDEKKRCAALRAAALMAMETMCPDSFAELCRDAGCAELADMIETTWLDHEG